MHLARGETRVFVLENYICIKHRFLNHGGQLIAKTFHQDCYFCLLLVMVVATSTVCYPFAPYFNDAFYVRTAVKMCSELFVDEVIGRDPNSLRHWVQTAC